MAVQTVNRILFSPEPSLAASVNAFADSMRD
jgi:hypothetical protein